MEEKRHSKRYPVKMELEISSLFKQDNVKVDNIHAPIEVMDISKNGIGFRSSSVLPLNYYFNSKIQLGDTDSCLYTVVKIIRQQVVEEDVYFYGCEFVGMPSVLDYIFDELEEKINC
jgi:hypothetical protein